MTPRPTPEYRDRHDRRGSLIAFAILFTLACWGVAGLAFAKMVGAL